MADPKSITDSSRKSRKEKLMLDNEKICIIIATHNNANTILRAVDSVTKGIRPANQVIVGDNDSKDGTYETLCNRMGVKLIEREGKTGFPPLHDGEINGVPVRIFRKQLSTIGHTVNIAVQMKWQGVTIFGFMEPTSWYAPDKISQAIYIFDKIPPVACVVSDCDNHFDDGRVERVFRPSFNIGTLFANFVYDRNFLVRTAIFPKLKRGFDEQLELRDDYEFLIRVSEVGLIYHIPAPLHYNVVHDTNDVSKIIQAENSVRQLTVQRRQGK